MGKLSVLSVLASLALAGCSIPGEDIDDLGDGLAGKGDNDSASPYWEYAGQARCWPNCPTTYVKQVNRRGLQTVNAVDWTVLGFDPEQRDQLVAAYENNRAIVRGSIIDGKLVVTEAWQATSAGPGKGRVYRVTPGMSGCSITDSDCAITADRLNGSWKKQLFFEPAESFDVPLALWGAISERLAAGADLLVGGTLKGTRLLVTQVYIPADGGPRTCGGITGAGCAMDEYCDYGGNNCGRARDEADQIGTCTKQPGGCQYSAEPVDACGCDGKTYVSDCEAYQAGVDIAHYGVCEPRKCGRELLPCDVDEYCDFRDDMTCGGPNEEGTCEKRPDACPEPVPGGAPLCGCDGDSYQSICAAHLSGTDVDPYYQGCNE